MGRGQANTSAAKGLGGLSRRRGIEHPEHGTAHPMTPQGPRDPSDLPPQAREAYFAGQQRLNETIGPIFAETINSIREKQTHSKKL